MAGRFATPYSRHQKDRSGMKRNPAQTSAIFGVWKGFIADAVDAGFPLQL